MNTQLKKIAGSRHDPATNTHPGGHATKENHIAFPRFVNDWVFNRALWWLRQGVELVPVCPNSKRLVKGFGPYLERIRTEFDAERWFLKRHCNLAVVCGSGPGLVCVDFDNPEAFARWLSTHDIQTLVETSCHAGRGHVFFFDPGAANGEIDGGEVRARSRVVTVAPSAVEGARYGILRNREVLRVDVADLFLYKAKSPPPTISAEIVTRPRCSREDATLSLRIKRATNIVRYVSSLLGAKGECLLPSGGSGQWWKCRCPFHDDKHPSFWVNVVSGKAGCQVPSCPAYRGRDVIDLHALRYGLTVREAMADLAKELHLR